MDWVVLMAPFQLGVFCDAMILSKHLRHHPGRAASGPQIQEDLLQGNQLSAEPLPAGAEACGEFCYQEIITSLGHYQAAHSAAVPLILWV